jgi:Zn-dependent oligopeptidase
MKYCKNRKLRETMARANGQKATGGEFNNQQNVIDIVRLRIERAKLLGYKTHAEFVLEKRMAKKPHDVWDFLHNLLNTSKAVANKELDELKALASELDGIEEFQTWDTSFYSEILKQRKLSFDDQVLKPYFEINRVLEGMFLVAEKLYNISFAPNTTAPVYHKDVLAYDVADLKTNKSLGLFYVDLFPRETKRQGAWMMSFREQGYYKGKVRRPVVAIVCNFPTPTDDNPSLLSLNEVTTLFHEFGHALHVLLTQCQYQMLSGASVYWDFVELPSQIMENWVKEKECLDLFAKHFETGEGINSEIIHKIKESNQFLEGLQTLRQVSFALLDMNWHDLKEVPTFIDVEAFEKQAMHEARLLPENPGNIMSTSFGHLFAGGYSAGYYSYKWAEVLDADAFEYFLENGIFNREIGEKFRTCILEKGGVDDPMELYKSFRGREPKIDALMKRAGFYQ